MFEVFVLDWLPPRAVVMLDYGFPVPLAWSIAIQVG